jgi:hypothetical protein
MCLVRQRLHVIASATFVHQYVADSAAIVLYNVYNPCTCWLTRLPCEGNLLVLGAVTRPTYLH